MILSISNHKGGTGKTSTAVNLAHALANRGKRVLVIDQDSQCNSTSSLLPSSLINTVPNSLLQIYEGEKDVSRCIYPSQFDGVDILPNNPLTAAMEIKLYENIGASARLYVDVIKPYAEANYDFTIFDLPPTIGVYLLQALAASSACVVPLDIGSAYAIDGLQTSIRMIDDVAQKANPSLVFLRILINKADLRTSIARTLLDFITRTFGEDKVFRTTIPFATAIQQAELARTSVIKHAPSSAATKRYRELAEELINITAQMNLPLEG